jgi:uncharacterized Fe-S cluster-containing radical SAM superfamily protein
MKITSLEHIDTESRSEHLRKKVIDTQGQRLLIANFHGSEQEKDLTVPPNCEGFGRIRHFRRKSSTSWVNDPLPMDPVCKAFGLPSKDMIRAQVFQIAACNFRCWYCFVPGELLEASSEHAEWLTPGRLVELYLDQEDPPLVIDLSGGQPDLAPEWVPWMMKELIARGLDRKVYLWSDDNLSTDYFWRFLSGKDQEVVGNYRNYSKVCCFKGFDSESFAFNTRTDSALFDRQFELMGRLLDLGIDLYSYVTFTTGSSSDIEGRMHRFIDRLQSLDDRLPLRTVPLEIRVFTPVRTRLNNLNEEALKNQYLAVDSWRRELENRYTAEDRARNIADIALQGHSG